MSAVGLYLMAFKLKGSEIVTICLKKIKTILVNMIIYRFRLDNAYTFYIKIQLHMTLISMDQQSVIVMSQ